MFLPSTYLHSSSSSSSPTRVYKSLTFYLSLKQAAITSLLSRLHITNHNNAPILQARLEVVDLFTDLADGKMLLKLLEIISGEKLGKPNNGKMRVHKIENVNKSLAFLHTKVSTDGSFLHFIFLQHRRQLGDEKKELPQIKHRRKNAVMNVNSEGSESKCWSSAP